MLLDPLGPTGVSSVDRAEEAGSKYCTESCSDHQNQPNELVEKRLSFVVKFVSESAIDVSKESNLGQDSQKVVA